MKYDIFISYRRKESSGRSNVPMARTFKLEFEGRGYKVFFDYSECTDNYFSETILPAIRTCDYFVLILTADCLSRCVNEQDWIRREIEEALASDRKIIPITPDNECNAWTNLPDSLKKLDGLQITTIHTDQMFESCVDFLIGNRFHNETPPIFNPDPQPEPQPEPEPKPKLNNKLWLGIGAVAAFILILLQAWPKGQDLSVSGSYNGHDYVDLGLPSGTLWATCNVGAYSSERYGDYFAWGETQPKTVYNWKSYKYCSGSESSLTKYCCKTSYGYKGFFDNLRELQSIDDAATENWGDGWSTPTRAQWRELLQYTTGREATINGIKGRMYKASNGKGVFLPFAGEKGEFSILAEPCSGDKLVGAGESGLYWMNMMYNDNAIITNDDFFEIDNYFQISENDAFSFHLYSDKSNFLCIDRAMGVSVRPVTSWQIVNAK